MKNKTFWKWTKRLVLMGLSMGVVGFLAIQLVPVDRSNPPVVSEPEWDSPETRDLMERACFDCHSNETEWPWYSQVAPVSWLVSHNVNEGREHVNYSDWENVHGEGRSAHEAIETIHYGWMPPRDYLLMHPDARLTADEEEQLIAGIRATFSR